jgi:hypothetical protein
LLAGRRSLFTRRIVRSVDRIEKLRGRLSARLGRCRPSCFVELLFTRVITRIVSRVEATAFFLFFAVKIV